MQLAAADEVDDGAARVARRLTDLGARAGDRVLVAAANRVPTLSAVLGCLRLGVVPVPVEADLPAAAAAELRGDCDPRLVLDDDGIDQALRSRPLDGLPHWPRTRPMHYTSGTTGRRKGVHAGDLGADGGAALHREEREAWDLGPADVHLVVSALSHSGPLRFALNSVLAGGSVAVLGRFDAAAMLAGLAGVATTTFCVPTHLARLLALPEAASADLSGVRLLAHAGAPCPEPLKRRALDRFPAGSVHEFYGSTEGQFTTCSPQGWLARPGTVGRARAGRRLEVRHPRTGAALPDGEVGTVWTTAPPYARFTYWRDPAATARAWDGDAFTVGDLGRLDDGWLTLAGRPGDLVITGGVNVYPAEVERVLAAHPAVAEGVVHGVPDEAWGSRVVATVVLTPGAQLDPAGLRSWLRARLTGAQTPKEVRIVADLPRTHSGKVLRRALEAG